MTPVIPIVLFLGGGLALLLTLATHRRPGAPGVATFAWLCVAMAVWCIAGGFHALADTLTIKLFWAKVQYVGICSVPPLWLLFAADYAGVGWIRRGHSDVARSGPVPSAVAPRELRITPVGYLWMLPVVTMALAATNEFHRAIWTRVAIQPSGFTTYHHGWWFWLDAGYNYLLVLGGALLIAQAIRRSPPLFRGQLIALIVAAIVPWAGNLTYILGMFTAGFDVTPLAFTVSGALFAWALYSNHLFDLVPVARDMVVDSLGDAVIVVDPSRRILDMNATAQHLVRAERHWIGQPLDAAFSLLVDTPLEPTQGSPMMVVARAAAEPSCYDVRVMPVQTRNGRLAAWAVLLRDVSEQRRAAEERDAFHARAQEQQRREGLSILAAGLAHDFNNLLAGIVGNADLLALRVPPASEMSSSVSAIQLGAQRAADLVSKMLAYAGERHGTTGRLDLDQLVRELLDLLRASAGRHCTIEYSGEPVVIQADATQIRQVAMNLIINAAEAVDENSGAVTIIVGTAVLSPRELAGMKFGQDAGPGRYAYLEVRDNGSGMDDATLRRIFQPFFTTKAAGHGLGLAAVQGIVLGHRGAMRVETTPGAGSRFCVWFPRAEAAVTLVQKTAS
jgi:signal transduction histidine kinase